VKILGGEMKRKLTLIILLVSIVLISQSAWALRIVSPKEGDTVYAGDNLTIIVKPDPGENWVGVSFGFDAMTYNPLTDEYKITIQVPRDYYGYYDNLVVDAADSSGHSIELRGKIFVKMPPNVVLQSIVVDDYRILYKLPLGSSPEEMQRIESRPLRVEGMYSDGVKRELNSSASGTTYTSSDETIVTVDTEGKMTAQKLGKAKITIKNGNYSATVVVAVKPYKK